MELNKILKLRRSVRSYLKKPVSRELLVKLIKAASLAPTSCNLQLTKYIILDNQKLMEKLGQEVSYKFISAPACILILYDPRFTAERNSVISSAAMASQNILLKAVDLGLSACPMAGFSKDEVIRGVLKIPKELEILLLISIGFISANTGVTVSPFKIPPTQAYKFNDGNFGKDLNPSPRLADHSVADVIKYRSRISTVYLDRFALNSFPKSFYDETLKFCSEHIISAGVKDMIDVMSYDGLFLKCLYSNITARNLDITASDYLKTTLAFFKKTFDCKTCLISEQNQFINPSAYDMATLVFQSVFTPELKSLTYSINKILKPGGCVFVAHIEDGLLRRCARKALAYWRKIKGKRVNIYEGNSFYKIGAYQYLSSNKLIKIFKNSHFFVAKQSHKRIGRGLRLKMFILKKEN